MSSDLGANKKSPRKAVLPKSSGRPKGSVNKLHAEAKDAIADAARGLGGARRLATWAKESPENERAFWVSIYPKLIPLQVGGDPNGAPIVTEIIQRIVRP